ncbi:MAG: hypothetical protein AAGB93_08860, partial [Planctomycetota bacterium]
DLAQLVRTFPDLAERALLSSGIAPRTQETIAAWLDGAAAPARGGWALLVSDRAENPARYEAWAEQRAAAWAALRRGAFAEVAALEVPPPTEGPTPWPEADLVTLRATAMMAGGRPAEAAELFARAAQSTGGWDARFAARAGLFSAFGHQLAGDADAAARSRAEALRAMALESVQDPMILRLLLETEPSASASIDEFPLRSIRARLGRVELQRGAPQAALLALRAAESESGTEPSLDRLRLGQAEALIALDQDQPATAMLAGLASSDVRPEALTVLGLLQMRRGQSEMAVAVFREAVRSTTCEEYPGVCADAGLALLSAGNRDLGLSLLHEARDEYQARGDLMALRRLLNNELRYAQAIDDPDLANEAREMLLGSNP